MIPATNIDLIANIIMSLKQAEKVPEFKDEAIKLNYKIENIIQMIFLDNKEAQYYGKTLFMMNALSIQELEDFFIEFTEFVINLKKDTDDEIRKNLRDLLK